MVAELLSSFSLSPDTVDVLSLMEAVPRVSTQHALKSAPAGCSLNDPALLSLREAGRVAIPASSSASPSFFSCAFLFRTLGNQPIAAVLTCTRLSTSSSSSAPGWQGRLELRTSLAGPCALEEAALHSFLAFLTQGLFIQSATGADTYGSGDIKLFSPPAMAGKLQALLTTSR